MPLANSEIQTVLKLEVQRLLDNSGVGINRSIYIWTCLYWLSQQQPQTYDCMTFSYEAAENNQELLLVDCEVVQQVIDALDREPETVAT